MYHVYACRSGIENAQCIEGIECMYLYVHTTN